MNSKQLKQNGNSNEDDVNRDLSADILKTYCEKFSRVPVAVLDNEGRIIDTNRWFRKLCDQPEILPGTDFRTIIEINKKPAFNIDFSPVPSIETRHFVGKPIKLFPQIDYQGIVIRKNGCQYLFFKNKLDETDKILQTVTELNMDISELARDLSMKNQQLTIANKKITELLESDTLTGIKNRRFMSTELDRLISYVKRNKTPCFSIIMFDIDHFKQVNDKYGHDLGDQVLIAVTALFSNMLRQEDTLARFGGEEFIITLINQNIEQAVAAADRLRRALESSEMPRGLKITASFGVAQFMLEENKEVLLKNADDAMYEAKNQGRNRVIAHINQKDNK
jgi:diguanylate cyclase (GGDEF)-like protein